MLHVFLADNGVVLLHSAGAVAFPFSVFGMGQRWVGHWPASWPDFWHLMVWDCRELQNTLLQLLLLDLNRKH